MAEGAGDEHDLAAVMTLMRDEIAEDVPNIQGKVAPRVGPRGRDASAVLTTELQQARDPDATAL